MVVILGDGLLVVWLPEHLLVCFFMVGETFVNDFFGEMVGGHGEVWFDVMSAEAVEIEGGIGLIVHFNDWVVGS